MKKESLINRQNSRIKDLKKDIKKLYTIKNVTFLPILHYQMEYAQLVRAAVNDIKPDAVALELPFSIKDNFITAIKRLPYLSVILIPEKTDIPIDTQNISGHLSNNISDNISTNISDISDNISDNISTNISSNISDNISDQEALHYDEIQLWQFLTIEPTDPMVEAARYALKENIPLYLIDSDTNFQQSDNDPIIDPYTGYLLGQNNLNKMVQKNLNPCENNNFREEFMAVRLNQINRDHNNILFLCGLRHAEPIMSILNKKDDFTGTIIPFPGKTIEKSFLFNPSPEMIKIYFNEMPVIMSAWEAGRAKDENCFSNPVYSEDEDIDFTITKIEDLAFDSSAEGYYRTLGNDQALITNVNHHMFEEEYSGPDDDEYQDEQVPEYTDIDKNPPKHGQYPEDGSKDKYITPLNAQAFNKSIPAKSIPAEDEFSDFNNLFDDLLKKEESGENRPDNLLFFNKKKDRPQNDIFSEIIDFFMHLEQLNEDKSIFADSELEPVSKKKFNYANLAEKLFKSASVKNIMDMDRLKILIHLINESEKRYSDEFDDSIGFSGKKNLFHFARNYSLIEKQILPDLWRLITAARGVGGDSFAIEVHDLASIWPWQDSSDKYETFDPELALAEVPGRKINLKKRLNSRIKRYRPAPLRLIKKHFSDNNKYNTFNICSYPPEDIIIENWAHYLLKKGDNLISSESVKIEEFSTSMLDGLAVRETMKHWSDKKIYVKEKKIYKGTVGAVVVIFNNDENDEYNWKMTWQGEHDQESDMALYSTNPEKNMVGPGVFRCIYGGFLMTYPPKRMYSVWEDPGYSLAKNKPEHLLMAAVEYSLEKNIVYVSASPPSSRIVKAAKRLERKIIYFPLGGFSQSTLNKIRVFHVLSDNRKRKIAKDYISR